MEWEIAANHAKHGDYPACWDDEMWNTAPMPGVTAHPGGYLLMPILPKRADEESGGFGRVLAFAQRRGKTSLFDEWTEVVDKVVAEVHGQITDVGETRDAQ